ncbi:MAG: NAD(P)H-hydrate dehydratase [Candidatus Omnitrophota bacterium]|nr:NAD(P)H-hydrate dehydratase [Candidatus Omnitrophota bacterium]
MIINKQFLEIIAKRKQNSHKGDYGHVLVLSGSEGMTGAASLCSLGALRSGCGLVTLGIPRSLNPIMEVKLTEVMTKPLVETTNASLSLKAAPEIKRILKDVDVVALGPGLTTNKGTKSLVNELIKTISKPLVLDADGLNCIAGNSSVLKLIKYPVVITPHPGEMARLARMEIDTIQRNRQKVAKDFANRHNLVVVLKGYQTVVAGPETDSYVNKTGNSGMATAGAGDILTGMIASLISQGIPEYEAAKLAVYTHGKAGDLASKKKGKISLIASDILDNLAAVFKALS